MPKYVAICLAANNATYDAELFARVGQNYDHHYEGLLAWQADGANIGWDTTVYGGLFVEVFNDWPTTGNQQAGRNDIISWICDSSQKIGVVVRGAPGHIHDGTFKNGANFTGACVTQITYERAIFRVGLSTQTGYFRVEDLIMSCTQARGAGVESTTTAGADVLEIERCLFEKFGKTAAITLQREGMNGYIANNIVRDCIDHGIYIGYRSARWAYNNTCVNNKWGIYLYRNHSSADLTLKNNVCTGNTTADYDELNALGTVTALNNISSDGTATAWGGTGNQINQTVTYVDDSAAVGDFHLDDTDTGAKGKGLDLSSDPEYPITDDIDGETRSAPWDCGADQTSGGQPVVEGKNALYFSQEF